MGKQTLQIVGTLILIAGFALGSIGTYRLVTNLPISDAEALKAARRSLAVDEKMSGNPGQASLQGNVELQVWQSALKMTNKGRKERRGDGAVFFVSGIIAAIWGMTILHSSRSTPSEP